MKKIAYDAVHDAVVEIPQTAGEDQSQCDVGQAMTQLCESAEDEQAGKDGDDRKHNKEDTFVGAETEDRAAIDHQLEMQEIPGENGLALMAGDGVVKGIIKEPELVEHDRLVGNVAEGP